MSYKEAVEDGVKCSGEYSGRYYYPKCSICGKEVPTWSYIKNRKYKCKECRTMVTLHDREVGIEENYELKERKFENAIKRIENSNYKRDKKDFDFSKYEYAISRVHEKLHTHGWYQSTEEIIAAIMLIKNKVKARHQVKMGKYMVDFLLPEEKIILEIDGTVYHTAKTLEKEKLRDSLIILALGATWEVIRITDEHLNGNPKNLIKAIRAVKKNRQRIRKLYNGQLEGYSVHNI